MFYQTVVLEKGYIIDGGLNTKDQSEFVVHFDGNRTHGVSNPSTFNACAEVVAHLVPVTVIELSAQKGGYVVRLYGVDRSAGKIAIDQLEVFLMLEDNISGVLSLHDAPVVPKPELLYYWAIPLRKKIELLVKSLHFEVVTEALCPVQVRDRRKDIVHECKCNVVVL
jgi:hypothetical protein